MSVRGALSDETEVEEGMLIPPRPSSLNRQALGMEMEREGASSFIDREEEEAVVGVGEGEEAELILMLSFLDS